MSGRLLLAAAITVVGALITFANLRGGLELSIPLLLGVLLLVDGALRLSMLAQDGRPAAREAHPAPAGAEPAVRSSPTDRLPSPSAEEAADGAERPTYRTADAHEPPTVAPSSPGRGEEPGDVVPPARVEPGDEDRHPRTDEPRS
jgi:hypothetical protein